MANSQAAPATRPNFLIVVADDLGFSDVKPYGGEIHTPTLDRLAAEGVRFTNFHTASACSPTRSMLLSGTDNHIAGLGQMGEQIEMLSDVFGGRPGYEGHLNMRVAALSEIMQDAGYFTAMSGKWHLGQKTSQAPCARGFTRNFTLLPGASNHYNYEPQLAADSPFRQSFFFSTDGLWMEDERTLDCTKDFPADFYTTASFTDRLLGFLDEHAAGPDREQPFFAYLPYTAPHWPLQAPRDTIAQYAGRYDDGPTALRAARLERLVELGLVAPGTEASPMVGYTDPEWEDLTPAARAVAARKMEVYAAMVHEMDRHLGRVIESLETRGQLDNTFVLFMSDNGAEGALLEAVPMMGSAATLGGIIDTYYDNSLENIGNGNSYVWYGPRWACAATAPSQGFKTWITEGGIRCPCIVRYPPLHTPAHAVTPAFATVMDILPTVLDLAGVPQPPGVFRGREVVPVRGKSWVPHLGQSSSSAAAAATAATTSAPHRPPILQGEVHDPDTTFTGWELFGACAVRRGKWKAVYQPPPRGKDQWQLFDLSKDPAEMHDLADQEKDVLDQMLAGWASYEAEAGVVDARKVQFPFTKGQPGPRSQAVSA